MKESIVIATIKSWNIANAKKFIDKNSDKYNIFLIEKKEDLFFDYIKEIKPRYIFFPHWSWIIPKSIYENFECIVFHITDLPFGRGGSPLQNLISRNIDETAISALKVEKGLDTGKIYLKEPFLISLGSAEEIFEKVSEKIFNKLITRILENAIIPYEQFGEIICFNRRKEEESNFLDQKFLNIDEVFNFIRMLDAEGYPNAFINLKDIKILFSEVSKKNGKLFGRFEINYE